MDWFGRSSDTEEGRLRSSYNYAYDQVQQSPTIFTAILTMIACITSVWSGMETAGTVAGPFLTAVLFLAHNVHQRKANSQVKDALEEVRAARVQIGDTHGDLEINTQQTVNAVAAAEKAAAAAEHTEQLVANINAKLEALHAKKN